MSEITKTEVVNATEMTAKDIIIAAEKKSLDENKSYQKTDVEKFFSDAEKSAHDLISKGKSNLSADEKELRNLMGWYDIYPEQRKAFYAIDEATKTMDAANFLAWWKKFCAVRTDKDGKVTYFAVGVDESTARPAVEAKPAVYATTAINGKVFTNLDEILEPEVKAQDAYKGDPCVVTATASVKSPQKMWDACFTTIVFEDADPKAEHVAHVFKGQTIYGAMIKSGKLDPAKAHDKVAKIKESVASLTPKTADKK